MWALNQPLPLPRSKQSFTLLSKKGMPMFIKPGKLYFSENNSWITVRNLATLHRKITSLSVSPNGRYVIQLPILTPVIAIHDTRKEPLLIEIPVPTFVYKKEEDEEDPTMIIRVLPEGYKIRCSNPFQQVKDLPYVFNAQNKPITQFSSLVQQFTIADSGKIAALLLEDDVWIWQQLDDQYRGVGFWTNLSANQHFPTGWHSAEPDSIKIHKYLAVFDNPDEGRGACFVTAVLPPSRPFDTIYIFNSICNFRFTSQPEFARQSVTLPVTEGYYMPKMWWSPCCKILLVAVARNVILLTRDLDVIAIIPLIDIFTTDETEVAWVAWSSSMQFCVLTSTTGLVGAITRSGVSLKHKICHMPPFDREKKVPLGVYSDSELGNVFIVYSREKYRHLKIDQSLIPQVIENILSLPYPHKLTAKIYPQAIKMIHDVEENGSIKDFCKILWFADLYRVFPEHSPLRYDMLELIKTFMDSLLKGGQNDALCFFLLRAILRITGDSIPAVDTVMKYLSNSKDRKDRLLLRVLDEEVSKRDYVVKRIETSNVIKIYEPTEEDDNAACVFARPHHNKEVDVHKCINFIKNLLFNREFDRLEDIEVDLSIVLEMMIELGKFTRALQIAQHPSIESDPTRVYARVVSLHPQDAAIIYRTMIMCIPLDYNNEFEIREICMTALLNIMRQQIADTAPDMAKKDEMAISDLCMLEESLDFPVPEREEECNDFSVIATLCLCCAGFQNDSYFFNGKSKMIPEILRDKVRETFRLLWYVRWRHSAFQEALLTGRPGDATLRLLEFPEFVDVSSIREMIEHCDENFFTPEVYNFYMGQKNDFELDPDFVDFACECSARITQVAIDKVSKAVLSFSNPEEEVIDSPMLLAAVVSHLLPWLRVALPLAMVGVETQPLVPNSLLIMEPYQFTRIQEKEDIKIVKQNVYIEPVHEAMPNIESMLEEEDDGSDDDSKYGEYNYEVGFHKQYKEPVNKLPIAMPPPTEDYLSEGEEDLRHKKSKKSDKDKDKKKKNKKDKKDKSKDKKKEKEQKKKKDKKREKPKLRLIDVDNDEPVHHRIVAIPGPAMVPTIPPMPQEPPHGPHYGIPLLGDPQKPYVPSVYMPAIPGQGPAFGPLWDMDPSLFERNFPKPGPNIPMVHGNELPKYTATGVQSDAQQQPPKYVVLDRRYDDSSTLSDIVNEPNQYPTIDPFPLDDELRRRVERLLNNPDNYSQPSKGKVDYDGPVRDGSF